MDPHQQKLSDGQKSNGVSAAAGRSKETQQQQQKEKACHEQLSNLGKCMWTSGYTGVDYAYHMMSPCAEQTKAYTQCRVNNGLPDVLPMPSIKFGYKQRLGAFPKSGDYYQQRVLESELRMNLERKLQQKNGCQFKLNKLTRCIRETVVYGSAHLCAELADAYEQCKVDNGIPELPERK